MTTFPLSVLALLGFASARTLFGLSSSSLRTGTLGGNHIQLLPGSLVGQLPQIGHRQQANSVAHIWSEI